MHTVISEEAAKAKARALRAALAAMGIVVKHTQSLELVAKLEGQGDWSTLNAKQDTASAALGALEEHAPLTANRVSAPPTLVGVENLRPGHTQVDEGACNTFGDKRKTCLYDAMRVTDVPNVYWHPVVEAFQLAGGFSAPPKRFPMPARDIDIYRDDCTPCNMAGETRLAVLSDVVIQLGIGPEAALALIEEYRARGGLTASFARL